MLDHVILVARAFARLGPKRAVAKLVDARTVALAAVGGCGGRLTKAARVRARFAHEGRVALALAQHLAAPVRVCQLDVRATGAS